LEERLKRRATSRRATHITGRKNWLL
jgi:hypothetical protein